MPDDSDTKALWSSIRLASCQSHALHVFFFRFSFRFVLVLRGNLWLSPHPTLLLSGQPVNVITPVAPKPQAVAGVSTSAPPMVQMSESSVPAARGTRIGRYVVDTTQTQAQMTAQPAPPLAVPSAQSNSQEQKAPLQPPQQSSSAAQGRQQPLSRGSARVEYSATASSGSQVAHVREEYQCPDPFMCMTQGVVAQNAALQQKSKMPFGVALHPLHPGQAVPVVNMGSVGIVRCKTCRAYINPFVEWLEGGRRWRCNLCAIINDVTGAYFSPLNSHGIRTDAPSRPELSSGIVDFVAPAEYMVRAPMAPAYLFILDVSYYAVYSGMVTSTLRAIREALPHFPGGDRTRIGFITFDSSVTLYGLEGNSPKAYVIGELDDSEWSPLAPHSILVPLRENLECVEKILAVLEELYSPEKANSQAAQVDTCLGPALRMATSVIKNWGGRILAFASSISRRGKGLELSNREQELGKLIGSENESVLFRGTAKVQEQYRKMAVEMSKAQVACDVFSFAPYIDLATLDPIVQLTGGQSYFYGPDVQKADADREKLFYDVFYALTKEQFWEGVMRLRCSKGVSVNPGAIFGNFHIRSSDLLALPCIDSDKGFAFSLKVEENLAAIRRVSFQVALLYTSSNHERRIRVLNKCLPVSASLADLFRTAQAEVLADLIFKAAAKKAVEQKVVSAREGVLNVTADILHTYKTAFSANVSGELVIPESLKMLPLYALGMIKNPVLRIAAGERVDRRVHMIQTLMHLPYLRSVNFAYPKMFAMEFPAAPLKLSMSVVNERGGVVLLDTTFELFIFVSRQSDPNLLAHVFAVTSFDEVDPNLRLPVVDSPVSQGLHSLIDTIRARSATWSRLTIVREGDARTSELTGNLIEDKMMQPTPAPSFGDFVRQLQSHGAKKR